MADYKVYFVGGDGHFKGAADINCQHDQAALEHAAELAKGKEVQVWRRDRRVAILNAASGGLQSQPLTSPAAPRIYNAS
jgi:hypothetical protein